MPIIMEGGRKRHPQDYYPTPLKLACASLRKVDEQHKLLVNTVLDPGAGDGIWGQAASQVWRHGPCVIGSDIRELPRPWPYTHWFREDFLAATYRNIDMVVGNPPYRFAQAFVERGLESVRDGGLVVFLLRLEFLASRKRARGLWQRYPPHTVFVLPERPSYTGNGRTDATEYAVFVFKRGFAGQTTLDWLWWQHEAAPAYQEALPL